MRAFSEMPGVWHARRAGLTIAAAVRRHSPRGIVLLYHRVAGPRRDPQWLDVSRANFEAHVAWIARNAAPLALAEFETRRRAGTLPSRAVAVTFDDGYADNLLTAAPLLAGHGVPATVFVTAGMTNTNREFWWDDAERIAFSDRRLATPVPGVAIPWSAADGDAPANGAHDDWTIAHDSAPTPRHRLYREICGALRPLTETARQPMLRELREWAGVDSAARATHRALALDEIRELSSRPGMTVGAHTMTHPVLALLPSATQRGELEESRVRLERATGGVVRSAAYPYGTRADVSAVTVRAARGAGFDFAMANEPAAAWRWSSRWRVPRFLVRDWSGDRFGAQLESWFAA